MFSPLFFDKICIAIVIQIVIYTKTVCNSLDNAETEIR